MPVPSTNPSASVRIPPTAPIRLMTAFAFERSGLMVTSGIRATAGERKTDMERSRRISAPINRIIGAGFALVTIRADACRAGIT